MTNNKKNPELELAEAVSRFYDDPLGFVMFAYPWQTNNALQLVKLPDKYKARFPDYEYGPDLWACEKLEQIGEEVKKRRFDGKNPVAPIRMADSSGHGIGKSTIVAWLVDWIMSTRPLCVGTITASTAPQLQTKTWAQVVKWTRICITSHWFGTSSGKGNMRMWHLQYATEWFCAGQTCKEENSEAFAGQHAASSTSFYIFDEASRVPNAIKEVAEGGLTDGEPMMFAFGNPTRNSGWFYDCFHSMRHRWITRKIDSRSVQITNKAQIQEWLIDQKDEGENSDFFKVRVRGEFPTLSINQLISRELAEEAANRKIGLHQYHFASVVLGVDCAWEGDDNSVVMLRQGLASKCLGSWNRIDDMVLGGLLHQWWDEHKVDALFIDVAWGSGVISYLRSVGRSPIPVNFGSNALNLIYKFKRTEMWCEMAKWLEEGGVVPNIQQLIDDLCAPDILPLTNGQKMLERKKDMKTRGIPSPDYGDALALTFASPIHKQTEMQRLTGSGNKSKTEYDVLNN